MEFHLGWLLTILLALIVGAGGLGLAVYATWFQDKDDSPAAAGPSPSATPRPPERANYELITSGPVSLTRTSARFVEIRSAAAVSVNLPDPATLRGGEEFNVWNTGPGQVNVAAVNGARFNTNATLQFLNQYNGVRTTFVNADGVWKWAL
jgi:hypothetical protein